MNAIPRIRIGANSAATDLITSTSNSGQGTNPDTPTCSVSQARLFPAPPSPLLPTSSSSSNSAALTILLVLPAMRTMPPSWRYWVEIDPEEILVRAAGDTVTSMLDSILCFSCL